jgi:hypothetical protein
MGRKIVAVMGTLVVALAFGMLSQGWASASPEVSHKLSVDTIKLHRMTDYITARPVKGPGGTEVRVKGYVEHAGQNCGNTWIQFKFYDAHSTATEWGGVPAGNIDFIRNVPSGSALGAGRVVAIRAIFVIPEGCVYRQLAAETPFKVTNGSGIFGFSPRKGPVGTVVTITGIRFTGAAKVKFNGTLAAFTVDSDTQITATVPAGATTGQIKIVTPVGNAGSGPNFRVT